MNATLQCFFHIEPIINFFKYKYNQYMKKIPKKSGDNLSSSFKILVDNLWPNKYNPSSQNNKKHYSPIDFKNKISKMNQLFESNNYNNIKYFLKFIIITLHKELNINSQKNKRNEHIIIDKRNKLLTYQNFMNEKVSYNNSIISDLFYGINCNIIKCCNCNIPIYDFQTYFLITFPLEEVYDYKKRIIKMQNQMNISNRQSNFNMPNIRQSTIYNNNSTFDQKNQFNKTMIYIDEINIYDCFEFDRTAILCEGDNSMYCDSCKTNSNCIIYKNLIDGPKILIILLNNGNGKSNFKFNFPDKLNLNNFIQNKNTGLLYELIGLITQIDLGNIYIAFCRDPLTNKWYKYNDININEVKDFQNEVINSKIPSILFYQKLKC